MDTLRKKELMKFLPSLLVGRCVFVCFFGGCLVLLVVVVVECFIYLFIYVFGSFVVLLFWGVG